MDSCDIGMLNFLAFFVLSLPVILMFESTGLRRQRRLHRYCRKIGSCCTILDRNILLRRRISCFGISMLSSRPVKRMLRHIERSTSTARPFCIKMIEIPAPVVVAKHKESWPRLSIMMPRKLCRTKRKSQLT